MAALGAGANEEAAQSLTASIIAAEAEGLSCVGLSHFIDYLEAIEAGRIDGNADPIITRPALAVYLCDARGGLAHTGFDRTIDDLAKAAKLFGVAIFSQKNAYTCGALGYFTGRLAGQGLVSFAATNGPAVLAGSGSVKPVYCTNPMSFAAPAADGAPLVIDQSSSATAFVNIRKAAEDGKKIPEGWALDVSGNPTTDPAAAMKGAMLVRRTCNSGRVRRFSCSCGRFSTQTPPHVLLDPTHQLQQSQDGHDATQSRPGKRTVPDGGTRRRRQ